MSITKNLKPTHGQYYLIILAMVVGLFAGTVLAGTGGSELNGILEWLTGLLQGTGGKLVAVIALLGGIAVTAVTFKVAGIGGLLWIVLASSLGVAVINGIITAVV